MQSNILKTGYLSVIFLLLVSFATAQSEVIISEFMALNNSTILDKDGRYSDWIEIYNGSSNNVSLLGWSLTDESENLSKWILPDINLPANSYLLIFASGNNIAIAGQELHTNFKLAGSGEYLALVKPDKVTKTSEFSPAYPAQMADNSYGILNGVYTVFLGPTPGSANSVSTGTLPPAFSNSRGIYSTAFELTLTAPQSGNSIYYTKNGDIPTKTNAQLYDGPISISATTPISAVTYNSSGVASAVVTHTYIFTESVLNQPNSINGYPSVWSTSIYSKDRLPADYEMDRDITNNKTYSDDLVIGLSEIPSIFLVTDADHFFSLDHDDSGGIYVYTGKTGDGSFGIGWEKPTSAEFFNPVTGQTTQVNCGVLLHGGNSRVPDNSQKHSLRLSFRSDYGASKLKYDFFESKRGAASEFNALVLRAGYNYAWTKNSTDQNTHADFIRDPFSKRTLLAMGNEGAHNRFVHLYINGIYWGVYNVSEKITNDFMETYMNGAEDDWDVVKDHSGTVDGSRNTFNDMMSASGADIDKNANYMKFQGLNTDGTINSSYKNYLDVNDFIDYMLVNYYIGNKDWDGNNWLAARNKINTKYGFRFFVWDAETTMLSANENITDMVDGEPTSLFHNLSDNNEFKLLVADRINKHFFHGGALSVTETTARYQKLVDEIYNAIIGESARWGDYRRDVMNDESAKLYTRNDHWLKEVNSKLSSYLPNRTQTVYNQLKNRGYYPSLAAPDFSSYGEKIETQLEFTITNPNSKGTIYYTIDGSDPRLMGGSIYNGALSYEEALTLIGKGEINARIKYSSTWSALTKAKFKGDTTDFVLNHKSIATISNSCYPNPAQNFAKFTYTVPQYGLVEIDILSLDGRVVKQILSTNQPKGSNTFVWNINDINSGIYIYEIRSSNRKAVGKIVIQK